MFKEKLQELQKKAHYQNFEMRRLEKLFMERYAGMSVLDIGCGQGRNFPVLEKAGCSVTGVDANEAQVGALAAQGKNVFTPKTFPVDGKYDVILMSHLIEHLEPITLLECFNFYLKFLKASGKLIIVTPVLGERFYYDSTHVRPYYPQSLWMMIGGFDTAMEFRSEWKMKLEDIYFFRDAPKPRNSRAYYPVHDVAPWQKWLVDTWSVGASLLYLWCGARLGTLASWMGVYGHAEKNAS